MRASLVLGLLVLLCGCPPSVTYEKDTVELHEPPRQRTVPRYDPFRDCLMEVFSRRIKRSLIEHLYEELKKTGTVHFTVDVDSYGGYYREHFISWLPGPQVLVVGRLEPKTHEVKEQEAFYIADPVKAERGWSAPAVCPGCKTKGIEPTANNCFHCGVIFEESDAKR